MTGRGRRVALLAAGALVLAVAIGTVTAVVRHQAAGQASAAVRQAARAQLPGPLHTSGRWIVDSRGRRVKLASVNWSGGETQAFTVGGLDVRRLDELAAMIRDGGFNAVRLPWSNQLVEDNPVVAAQYLSANPQLEGKHALEVLDAVIAALGRQGVMVVLDNHRSRADWCCDEEHGDGLWYTKEYPEQAWLADWKTVAARYRGARNVVAAELRNEIRAEPQLLPGPSVATWGDGSPQTDWRAAAERGGSAVLAANPDLLVIVGGTEYQGNLTGAATAPVRLPVDGRLVYAAHDYSWFSSATELADPAAFAAQRDSRWGYLTTPGQTYTAPVYVSETGTCTNASTAAPCAAADGLYLEAISRYLAAKDLDFAYWPLNGTQGTGYSRNYGDPELYGLLAPDWSGYGSQQVLTAVKALQAANQGPGLS